MPDTDPRRFSPHCLQHRPRSALPFMWLAFLFAAACSVVPTREAEVDSVYRRYRDAVGAGDGDSAVAEIALSTIERYQSFLDAALSADAAALNQLNASARLQVLLLRHRLAADRLQSLDGRTLLAFMIYDGWIAADTVTATQLGDVTIRGDHASAPLFNAGRPTRDRAHFVREGRVWKVNLLPNLNATADRLAQTAQAEGKTENEHLLTLVEKSTGQPPREDIWEPVRRAQPRQ